MIDKLYDEAKAYVEAVNLLNDGLPEGYAFPNLVALRRQVHVNGAQDRLIIAATQRAIATIEAGQYTDTPMKMCGCRGPEDFHGYDCKKLRIE